MELIKEDAWDKLWDEVRISCGFPGTLPEKVGG